MEGKVQRNIDIYLYTTSSQETPVSILSVSWPPDSSQLLLAVTHRGRMDRVTLVNRTALSSVTLTGFSRQKSYIVDVYGLVEVTGKRHSDVETRIYSIEASRRVYVSPNQLYSSKPQLLELLRRAKKFCLEYSNCPDTYPIKHFYRDKPGTYFQYIMEQNGGLMEKSLKDTQGDQFSPINNRIKGLMFSSSLDTRHFTPPFCSETGDQRMFIPVHSIFDAETNMFFADFYCHYDVHYVTLVLAKNGSTEDRFCKRKLVQLDKRMNPFVTVEKPKAYHHYTMKLQKTFRVVSVHKFKVEFFYTESIKISEWLKVYGPREMYFKTVEGYVKRKSRELLKNPSCLICNLPPC